MAAITHDEKSQKIREQSTEKNYIYPHRHCLICGKMIEDSTKQVCSKRCQEIYDLRMKKAQRRRRFIIYIIIYSAALFFVMLFASVFHA
ncbi:DUF2116 family Zn-ribbon domain-containing protein [Candidatus Bathyarchaeota archaeon]|nr:DUF2116 family Zn-ribbon domain-containing protein [Candidatus Bathyarchaeota archaeon]